MNLDTAFPVQYEALVQDLADLLQQTGPLTLEDKRQLWDQVCADAETLAGEGD